MWPAGLLKLRTSALQFTENGVKKTVSSSSEGRNALLMREVRGDGPDWFKLTGRRQ